jgi:two-component system OmpR family response regulator
MAHIVIIDDDTAVGDAYAAVLRDSGHDVSLYTTVADADAEVASGSADLVLLDLWLPNTCGLDYLKILLERETMPRVLAISGGGPGRSIEGAVTIAEVRGAVSSLVKPVTDDELIAAVDAALAR